MRENLLSCSIIPLYCFSWTLELLPQLFLINSHNVCMIDNVWGEGEVKKNQRRMKSFVKASKALKIDTRVFCPEERERKREKETERGSRQHTSKLAE